MSPGTPRLGRRLATLVAVLVPALAGCGLGTAGGFVPSGHSKVPRSLMFSDLPWYGKLLALVLFFKGCAQDTGQVANILCNQEVVLHEPLDVF